MSLLPITLSVRSCVCMDIFIYMYNTIPVVKTPPISPPCSPLTTPSLHHGCEILGVLQDVFGDLKSMQELNLAGCLAFGHADNQARMAAAGRLLGEAFASFQGVYSRAILFL